MQPKRPSPRRSATKPPMRVMTTTLWEYPSQHYLSEKTGKEVPWKSIVKGVQIDGEYVVLSPEDFKAAASQVARGGIEIVEFVNKDAVSPLHFEQPYYIAPGKGGEKVYALLRESLERSDRVGIAKVVIQTRERLAALMVQEKALVLMTIRFAEELREPDDLPLPSARAKVTTAEVHMAEKLIDGMTAKWDPTRYKNEYVAALRRVIKDKSRGPRGGPGKKRPVAEEEPPESYNLMELLKKSVESKPARTAKKSTRSPARRRAG